MSDATVYTQSGLQDGISSLRRAHKELVEMLETLKGELQQSLGMWEDNARVAYQEVQRSWDQSAERQSQIIEQMPVLLGQIADGYDATERSNASRWS
ncbi:WXG100 family type VII secretion target [Tessaracoccus sp. OH4464_COT-324]|uniref:WXG100 family type VII secretion target n=1 Tax=Tessaracoccus sp. OH4464_COT-324 TaxID=2491059 RepID=UPI000F634F7B|nr:WXG100 family type VII secretion target [Tessaracoccus sp. OH4464_COT-324]RRD46199.1 WXG100 family type VII secretion target [Tessaracoccus sp. OH4464_COT-324]